MWINDSLRFMVFLIGVFFEFFLGNFLGISISLSHRVELFLQVCTRFGKQTKWWRSLCLLPMLQLQTKSLNTFLCVHY